MLAIALSGPSGGGKTEIINALSNQFPIIPERYIELNTYSMNNKHAISKWAYVSYWINAVFEHASLGHAFAVSDRSPLDTAAYAEHGQHVLLPVLLQSMDEMRQYGHELKTILITASDEPARILAVCCSICARVTRRRILVRISSLMCWSGKSK